VEAQAKRKVIRAGGTGTEREKGEAMEILIMGEFTSNKMDLIGGTSQVKAPLVLTIIDIATCPLGWGEESLSGFLQQWR
jgi:hypothetical protein